MKETAGMKETIENERNGRAMSHRDFLMAQYSLQAAHLNAHFGRVWTRFNFFVVVESGLAALLLKSCLDDMNTNATFAYSAMGFLTASLWYVFAAQDRYLIEVYREHLADMEQRAAESAEISSFQTIGKRSHPRVNCHVMQWRWGRLSVTSLLVYVPLCVALVWGYLLVDAS